MKKIIHQLLPYIKRFKKHVILNVFFNLLYALFSSLAFVSLIPMLDVLFGKTTVVKDAPVWTGHIGDTKDYALGLLNYKVSGFLEDGNAQMALVIVISIVISTFILKNLFGYFF